MKFLIVFIAISNLLDALLTSYGLWHSLIEEKNPFMLYLWNLHPSLFLLVKLLLSFALFVLFFHSHIYKKMGETFLHRLHYLLFPVCALYVFILGQHYKWISYYYFHSSW